MSTSSDDEDNHEEGCNYPFYQENHPGIYEDQVNFHSFRSVHVAENDFEAAQPI